MELTDREKAIALAMLKLGCAFEQDEFVANGFFDAEQQMLYEIRHMCETGAFKEIFDDAEEAVEGWKTLNEMLDDED
jgi:hypothetical protein